MKTTRLLIPVLLFSALFIQNCKRGDDPTDPHDHNEEELITTVEIHLEASDGTHTMATWKDADGDGGEDPTIDDLILDTNMTYTASLEFLAEEEDEVHDVTHEIEDEAAEHIVCFNSSISELSISRTDSDGTYEIGLESEWVTTAAKTGTVTISLKHQPDVKDGTCSPGETDIEVTFPVIIE